MSIKYNRTTAKPRRDLRNLSDVAQTKNGIVPDIINNNVTEKIVYEIQNIAIDPDHTEIVLTDFILTSIKLSLAVEGGVGNFIETFFSIDGQIITNDVCLSGTAEATTKTYVINIPYWIIKAKTLIRLNSSFAGLAQANISLIGYSL